MAHPAETGPKSLAAFGSARLTPEEADRLAATIRPSWELDDAPFTGSGTLSEEDLRALQGGGIQPAVRAAAREALSRSQATNGSRPPPPATPSREPESSVILDPSLVAEIFPPDPRPVQSLRPGATMVGLATASQRPEAAPDTALAAMTKETPAYLQRPSTPQRPVAPVFQFSPPGPVRARPISLTPEEVRSRRPKKGLWVALGLGAVAMVCLVAWVAASSGSNESATEPRATPSAADDKASTVPPPPAVTATAALPAPVPEPPTTAAAPAPAPTPIAPTPVVAVPPPAQFTFHAAPGPAPRANYGGGNPGPRPAGKTKSGQTIVRDVPF